MPCTTSGLSKKRCGTRTLAILGDVQADLSLFLVTQIFLQVLSCASSFYMYLHPFMPSDSPVLVVDQCICSSKVNSIDPDQTPQNAASDLDLHCLSNKIYKDCSLKQKRHERTGCGIPVKLSYNSNIFCRPAYTYSPIACLHNIIITQKKNNIKCIKIALGTKV